MATPGPPKEQAQQLKVAIDSLGGFQNLQNEARKAAGALGPAIEALKRSFGGQPSAIDQARAALGDYRKIAEIQNATITDQERWNEISRSVQSIEKLPTPPRVSMPRITPLSEHLETALRNQEKRERAYRLQQEKLLSDIASAGLEQNQTMVAIVKLQEILVKESVDNSNVQRVVLIFSAASAFLSLIALIVTK
jgi:hypothetical protein